MDIGVLKDETTKLPGVCITAMTDERHDVANHRQLKYLLNSVFRWAMKEANDQNLPSLIINEGNGLLTDGPAQKDTVIRNRFICHDVIARW